jgi:hypothetical protein
MAYNVSFMNNGTAQDIFIGVVSAFPIFIPLLSIFEFFIILSAGTMLNAKRTGYSNILAWGSVASFTTATTLVFIGGVFRTSAEYLQYILPTVIIWFGLTAVFVLGFWLKKED